LSELADRLRNTDLKAADKPETGSRAPPCTRAAGTRSIM